MSTPAPPRRGGLPDAGRTIGRAAVGGPIAFAAVVAAGQLLGVVAFLLVGGYGLWSWAKFGLLMVLLSRSEPTSSPPRRCPPSSGVAELPITVHLRFVPMALTIGFLWLAARAGRRAREPGAAPLPSPLPVSQRWERTPVAILAAIAASLVTLSFSTFGTSPEVDAARPRAWAGFLAAAGAGTGADWKPPAPSARRRPSRRGPRTRGPSGSWRSGCSWSRRSSRR